MERKYDRFITGFIVGIMVPIAAYGILLTVYDLLVETVLTGSQGFRERSLALFALCFNLLPFHYFRRRHMDNAMRGMIIPTMIYVVLWVYFYGRYLIDLF